MKSALYDIKNSKIYGSLSEHGRVFFSSFVSLSEFSREMPDVSANDFTERGI